MRLCGPYREDIRLNGPVPGLREGRSASFGLGSGGKVGARDSTLSWALVASCAMLRRTINADAPARRFPRWLKVLLWLQVLVVLVLGGSYVLTQVEPFWWRDVKVDPATVQTAEQVENGVV